MDDMATGIPARPFNVAVLSVSDQPERDLWRGPSLAFRLRQAGYSVAGVTAVPDQEGAICERVQAWIDAGDVDVVLTVDETMTACGDIPPSIILTSDDGHEDTFSMLFYDQHIGCVGLVDIRSAIARIYKG